MAPLLTSQWGQGVNYNYYCPKDEDGTNGRCVTGCVATAMAQLIYYFRFPDTGMASYSYTHDTYGTLSANFGQTKYDYDAMTDKPDQINLPMSLLIHHCGVAVDIFMVQTLRECITTKPHMLYEPILNIPLKRLMCLEIPP